MKNLFVKNVGELFIGKKLSSSVKSLSSAIIDKTVTKDQFIEVIVQIFYRFTRIGLIAVLLSIIPVWLLSQQNKILRNQNKLIGIQIANLNNQNQLIESQRRSSLMFVYGNILEQINDDLNQNIKSRKLSPQTIGNIVSLSKGLKPYKFLEDSTLIEDPLSPERGQLLNTLLNSNISQESLKLIFNRADFSYSDLREFDLQNVKCIGCNLQYAEIHGSDLSFSDFSGSNLKNSCLKYSIIANTKFDFANLSNADFDECQFNDSTSFNKTIISSIHWFDEIDQTGYDRNLYFNAMAENHVIDTIGFTEFYTQGTTRSGFRVFNKENDIEYNKIEVNSRRAFSDDEILKMRYNILNNPNFKSIFTIDTVYNDSLN